MKRKLQKLTERQVGKLIMIVILLNAVAVLIAGEIACLALKIIESK